MTNDIEMPAHMLAQIAESAAEDDKLYDEYRYVMSVVSKALREARKAMKKYPQPNYVISKVAEESGEVVKAAIHAAEGREDLEEVEKESIQAIAMIIRLLIEGDEVHGLPPQEFPR